MRFVHVCTCARKLETIIDVSEDITQQCTLCRTIIGKRPKWFVLTVLYYILHLETYKSHMNIAFFLINLTNHIDSLIWRPQYSMSSIDLLAWYYNYVLQEYYVHLYISALSCASFLILAYNVFICLILILNRNLASNLNLNLVVIVRKKKRNLQRRIKSKKRVHLCLAALGLL